MSRILVVDDDTTLLRTLQLNLRSRQYDVDAVPTGQEALAVAARTSPDLAIVDLGLPDMDGLEVCQRARAEGYSGAILIVTARAGELDRVVGLDYGADDYLSKPFGLAELQARVRALLRRTGPASTSQEPERRRDQVQIDQDARRVFYGDAEVMLTGKEYDVLDILVAERGKVVSRERLMADVWDENWYGSTKTLDVTIGRLRAKLEGSEVAERIVAVRGVGFRLEGPSDA
jgi:DNA-binding response OmpR family regulator